MKVLVINTETEKYVQDNKLQILNQTCRFPSQSDLPHGHPHCHELIEAEWRIYALVIWPSLVQVMAWRRPGDKPLPETIMEYW